jgi:Na+-transporting NADH:ubiquinone oxidoreductase subunit NqrB
MGAHAEVIVEPKTTPAASSGSRLPSIASRFRDPRTVQLVLLGSVLAGGAWRYDLNVGLAQIALTFAAGIITQLALDRIAGRRTRSLRSPLVTSLSISILLRADSLSAYPAAAVAAIGSKYLLRARGKHLFNPSCFGVIFALCAFPGVWVSPGQWGAGVAIAGWIIAAGMMVTARAASADISASFTVFYGAGLAARLLWFGQRFAVLLHQMSNGALLLFAFFMLSDPKTIPDGRRGRIVHAATVAAVAFVLEFWLYANNALLWALFLAAPAVMLWDVRWPAPQFTWESEGENECAGHRSSIGQGSR